MVRKKGFNLLKTQIEPQTVWTKLYLWTTTTARAIMVVVELVIVISFGIRVVVDLQYKNLNKDIAAKEEVMEVLKESERRLVTIQNKSAAYKAIWSESEYYSDIYKEIFTIIPSGVEELNIQISNNRLIVKGFAEIASIQDMETKFKSSATFTNTELVNIETQGNSLDSFTIEADLNKPPKRSEIISDAN
jgi:hypothetical protein